MGLQRRSGVADFFARFPSDDACLEHVFATKWGTHSACPQCGQLGSWRRIRGTKKWRHSCRKHLSPLKDTIFYRSNLSLMAWFYALLLFANSSTGMRSSFIRRQLGLGHRSAIRVCGMIRVHMATMPRPAMLGGIGKTVHIDEAYLRFLIDHENGARAPAIVVGIACEGQVICCKVPDRKAATLIPLIKSKVVAGSTIITDMHLAYSKLAEHGYTHIRINHSKAFHDFNGNTNNKIEVFWATVKRTMRSYRQISPDKFWTFLAEIEFRYNRRHNRGANFEELISTFNPISLTDQNALRERFEWLPSRQPTADGDKPPSS